MQDGVRESAAAQLYQLCLMVAPEKGRAALTKPLLKLLDDASPAVLGKLLPHLTVCLSRLEFDAQSAKELCDATLRAEARIGRRWRLSRALLAALPALAEVVAADAVNDALLPLVFSQLAGGAAAARDAAAAALVQLFRMLTKERHRTEVRVAAPPRRSPRLIAWCTATLRPAIDGHFARRAGARACAA